MDGVYVNWDFPMVVTYQDFNNDDNELQIKLMTYKYRPKTIYTQVTKLYAMCEAPFYPNMLTCYAPWGRHFEWLYNNDDEPNEAMHRENHHWLGIFYKCRARTLQCNVFAIMPPLINAEIRVW